MNLNILRCLKNKQKKTVLCSSDLKAVPRVLKQSQRAALVSMLDIPVCMLIISVLVSALHLT